MYLQIILLISHQHSLSSNPHKGKELHIKKKKQHSAAGMSSESLRTRTNNRKLCLFLAGAVGPLRALSSPPRAQLQVLRTVEALVQRVLLQAAGLVAFRSGFRQREVQAYEQWVSQVVVSEAARQNRTWYTKETETGDWNSSESAVLYGTAA